MTGKTGVKRDGSGCVYSTSVEIKRPRLTAAHTSFSPAMRRERRARRTAARRSANAGEEEGAVLLQQLARDHEPLNLVRPLVDLRDLRVAHHALDRVLL